MRAFVFVLFCSWYSAVDAQTRAYVDSLAELIARSGKDTVRADALAAMYQAVAYDSADALTTEARLLPLLDSLQRDANPAVVRKADRARARYLYAKGYASTYTSNYSKALRMYTEAWRLLEAPTDRESLDHYKRLQRFYELIGDTARMVKFAGLMEPHAIALRDTSSLLLARMAMAIGDPARVPLGSLIALGHAFYKTPEDLGEFRWEIAWLLNAQGKQAEAIAHLERSIAQHGDAPPDQAFALMHWTLGDHYGKHDSLELGVRTLEKALVLTKAAGIDAWLGRERMMLGDLLIRNRRYGDAEQALLMAIAELQGSGQLEFELIATKSLKDLYVLQDRTRDALRLTDRWILLKDSVAGMRASTETARMEFDQEMLADSLAGAQVLMRARMEAEERIAEERRQRNVLLGFGAFAIVFAVVDYRRRRRIKKEHARSEVLLLNILPAEVAEELKAKGEAVARHFDSATILFTDFKGFTQLSEQVTPAELVAELNTCFKEFDSIMGKYRIEKIKTIGDAYMAAGGLPDPQHGSAADVVRAALEMQAFMRAHKAEREAQGKPFFEMRAGIHTGPVVAGIVGVKKFQYDIWGDTVNTASRMESSGEVGQVNISEATYAMVKDEPGLIFTSRGKVQAKGKGEMEMYFVRRSSERA